MRIHPSAKVGKNVFISETAFIGENVEIGDETYIGEGAIIEKNTKIGKKNKIYHYTVIGTPPQHLQYKDEETFVEIGDENIVREFATIHRGTKEGGGLTKIGSRNFIMAYAHIAHDCKVGSDCVITSFAALAGHTEVGDRVVFGGYSGSHQFVRVGKLVMIGSASFLNQDVPPFLLVVGVDPRIAGLNLVGLRRMGIPSDEVEKLKRAMRIYLDVSLRIDEVIQEIKKIDSNSVFLSDFCDFLKSPTKKGLLRKHQKTELSVR